LDEERTAICDPLEASDGIEDDELLARIADPPTPD